MVTVAGIMQTSPSQVLPSSGSDRSVAMHVGNDGWQNLHLRFPQLWLLCSILLTVKYHCDLHSFLRCSIIYVSVGV